MCSKARVLTLGASCGGLLDICNKAAVSSPMRVLVDSGCDGVESEERIDNQVYVCKSLKQLL